MSIKNIIIDGTEHDIQTTISNVEGLNDALKDKLSISGDTLKGNLKITNNSNLQSKEPHLNWKTIGTNTPYIGFAQDQVDGTFLLCSLKGANYQEGLAIGGGSGNLLWKGTKVATVSDIPSSLKNPNKLIINGVNYDGSSEIKLDVNTFYIYYTHPEKGGTWGSFDKSLEEIENAYQSGRQLICVYPYSNIEYQKAFFPLSMRLSAWEWAFEGYAEGYRISLQVKDSSTMVMAFKYTPAYILDTQTDNYINNLIEEKLATITNAEEVEF